LPFAIAERFAGKLKAAGLNVTWFPFDGGHEIPAVAVRELNAFLALYVGAGLQSRPQAGLKTRLHE
jgi:predicted esterase